MMDPNLNAEALRTLVHAFYARVRADAELGPIFNEAVADWPEHLERLNDFWTSIMLSSGRYKGNPLAMHLLHAPRITPALFERWLRLWAETSDAILPPKAAAAVQAKAARIADTLRTALCPRPQPQSPTIFQPGSIR